MGTNFLMIARILYDKGYTEYVEASKLIHMQYPNVRFLLLGGIDYENPNAVPEEIINKDHNEGNIVYLGYQPDVRKIISDADCIVLPSYYNEGLSRVLMEGLAMRKPLITTDMPGCKETVDNGINGYICTPRDITSLTECCKKFINLDDYQRKQMGDAGRKKAESRFDIKDVIKIYESITAKYQ